MYWFQAAVPEAPIHMTATLCEVSPIVGYTVQQVEPSPWLSVSSTCGQPLKLSRLLQYRELQLNRWHSQWEELPPGCIFFPCQVLPIRQHTQ